MRGRADRVVELEGALERLQIDAGRVSGLEAELLGFRSRLDDVTPRAERADGLEADLEHMAGNLAAAQAELATVRAEADRVAALEAELATVRAEADRVAALEAELAAVRSAADAARGEADGHVESMADLRVRLEAAEAKAALVPERDETMTELRRRLNRAEESASRAPAVAAEAPEKPHPSRRRSRTGRPHGSKATTKLGTPGADHVDDLKRIHGIGPVMEKTLQSFGIQTWEQVAAFTASRHREGDRGDRRLPGTDRTRRLEGWCAGPARRRSRTRRFEAGKGQAHSEGFGEEADRRRRTLRRGSRARPSWVRRARPTPMT